MSVRVLCNDTGAVLNWVAHGLNDDVRDYIPSLALGVWQDDMLIGGILINDITPQRNCWLTIYTESPRWATRNILKYVFTVVYVTIGAKRCSVFVSKSNNKSHDFCQRLGFKDEGLLREYRENGDDCYVMGMLKQECKWI